MFQMFLECTNLVDVNNLMEASLHFFLIFIFFSYLLCSSAHVLLLVNFIFKIIFFYCHLILNLSNSDLYHTLMFLLFSYFILINFESYITFLKINLFIIIGG